MNWLIAAYLFSAPVPDTAGIYADTVYKITKEHQQIVSDRLDNLFVINKDVITKYQQAGDSVLQQSFKKYGDVELFDATQALRPVLFYAAQSLAVLVDNTLSLQNEAIELSEWGFEQITLFAASSFNDGFWLFDNGTMELVRVDHTLKIINRSGNLTTALNQAPQPKIMKEYNNRLYMYVPGTGIAVFDQYANYLKTLPITHTDTFEVYGDIIFFLSGGDLWQYHTLEFITLPLTDKAGLVTFSVNGNRLYTGNGHSITALRFR